MNIGILSYLPRYLGGIQRKAVELAYALQSVVQEALVDSVIIIFITAERTYFTPVATTTTSAITPIATTNYDLINHIYPYHKGNNKWENKYQTASNKVKLILLDAKQAVFTLRKIIKKLALSHILFEHSLVTGIPLMLTKYLAMPQLRTIGIVHGAGVQRPLLTQASIKILNRCNWVVAVAEVIVHKLLKLGLNPTKLKYIPNWVDTTVFKPKPKKTACSSATEFDFIFAGSIFQIKQLDILLQALKYLSDNNYKTLQGVILGDGGKYKTKLELYAKAHGLTVEFKGWQSDILEWYYRSKFFVLVSKAEGMPCALLEAMACGLPPIATAVGDIPKIVINNYNGILIDSNTAITPQNLADKLLSLATDDNYRSRLGNNASKYIRDHYRLETIVPRYAELLV